jgi:outer membrane protein
MGVRQAFHGLVAARDLAEVALANLQNQKGNLALARARWESGLGLPADVVRASSAVATATVNLNAARARQINAAVALNRLLGVDPRTALEPVTGPLPSAGEGDLEVLIQEALEKRPEMVSAQRQIEAADHALRAARVNAAPSLAARAGLAARGQDYPPDSWYSLYGLEMEWPLVDSGATSGLVQEARALKDQAVARREVLRQDIASQIAQARVVLQVALDSLAAAEAAETDAREAVRIAEGRYGAGLGSFLEVLDAQSALLTASTQLVSARLAAWEARASFDRDLGRGLEP